MPILMQTSATFLYCSTVGTPRLTTAVKFRSFTALWYSSSSADRFSEDSGMSKRWANLFPAASISHSMTLSSAIEQKSFTSHPRPMSSSSNVAMPSSRSSAEA